MDCSRNVIFVVTSASPFPAVLPEHLAFQKEAESTD